MNKRAYKVKKNIISNKENALYIHLEKIPKKENEFYSVQLSNIANKIGEPIANTPRTVTAVYRSANFNNHAPE